MDEDMSMRHLGIESAIANVANKDKCAEILLKECEPNISPYDYLELSFIYQQLAKLNASGAKNALLVLEIIADYERLNPPDLREISQINQATRVLYN